LATASALTPARSTADRKRSCDTPKRLVARFPFWETCAIPLPADVAFDGFGRIAPLVPFIASRSRDAPLLAHARHTWDKDTHMITGTVKFFNNDKGFGFIAPEAGGGDAFVHISAVERAGMVTLDKDQRVSYELETDSRGKTSAVNLQAA
jgi:CspA family cold shock protein